MPDLKKFGTVLTGFTSGEYGPFQCGNCMYAGSIGKAYHVCENPAVHDDASVPEDAYGNKMIEPEDCCNFFTPAGE